MIKKYKLSKKIRKAHRYLGFFIGLQFLFWTISGLYFSWTNIDEIHGDHFRKERTALLTFKSMISPSSLVDSGAPISIQSIKVKTILNHPYYFINDSLLFDAYSGKRKNGISEDDAKRIARSLIKEKFALDQLTLIEQTSKHHEYRGKDLPAYQVSFKGDENLIVYISKKDGQFQRIRHNAWRVFDWFWMMHTMDYEGRDNINTWTLRIFSMLGFITVVSGFILFILTSRFIK